jgi:hypothetical protein
MCHVSSPNLAVHRGAACLQLTLLSSSFGEKIQIHRVTRVLAIPQSGCCVYYVNLRIKKVKFIILIISACTLLSFGQDSSLPSDTNSPSISDSTIPVVINEYIHSSLPVDWINEYNTIISNLKNLL